MKASCSCVNRRPPRIPTVFLAALLTLLPTPLAGCGDGTAPLPPAPVSLSAPETAPAAAPATNAPADTSSASLAPVGPAGLPLEGLTAVQRQQMRDGAAHFEAVVEAPRLGPVFNGRGCAECHASPVTGGAGPQRVTRFGRMTNGAFDPMSVMGGSLLQTFSTSGWPVETVPPEATLMGQRRTTAVFGFGLIEAIADADIEAYAAWQAAHATTQVGTVNRVRSASEGDTRVGRFGWKCQSSRLVDFAANALMNEMGVSNRLFPVENLPNAAATPVAPEALEDAPDADGVTASEHLARFMRFLAPYPSVVSTHTAEDLGTDLRLSRGIAAFERVGCAVCHKPSWVTAADPPELAARRVWTFSDFLLHDIGTGDGLALGSASGDVFRTAPLMGVRTSFGYLHDGSAPTVDAAIHQHNGQAHASRAAFEALTPDDQTALLRFVEGL